MTTFQAKDEFANALVEVVAVGLQKGRLADAEAVLVALRVLRPNLVALDTFDAWLAIKRGRFSDAARILRDMDAAQGAPAINKALRACCLFAIGDPEWTISANEVIAENADADAVALVRLLSGQPPEPWSAPAEQTGQAADAIADRAADPAIASLGYLRA